MAKQISFILYYDSIDQWNMLSNEQAGILIKAIYRYSTSGERLETSDGMLAMAFTVIAAQIDRDAKKYAQKCERNRQIAKEREERKHSEHIDTDAHECSRT